MLTATTAAPSASTPLFVPAGEAIRALVAQAETEGLAIDWDQGVTIKRVTPDTVTVDGVQVPVSGVVLLQATAETVEGP